MKKLLPLILCAWLVAGCQTTKSIYETHDVRDDQYWQVYDEAYTKEHHEESTDTTEIWLWGAAIGIFALAWGGGG